MDPSCDAAWQILYSHPVQAGKEKRAAGLGGTWRPGRRGRLVLEPANLPDVVAALNACLEGFSLKLKRYRHRVRVSPDGTALHGIIRITGRVRVRGQSVAIILSARYGGTPRSAA